jgi:hypothetical protein
VEDESAGYHVDADEKGTTANNTLMIPERLDGYPVVAIGVASGTVVDEGAFEDGGYADVTIPEGITSIGNRAFAGCHYIEVLTIPESVTYIAEDAFEGWYGDTTLRVVEGSYAAQYAEKNEFPYTYDMEYKVFDSGEWKYALADGTATICGYQGADGDLMIPDYLDEYPVTAIAYGSWVQWRLLTDNLVSVTIPDGITSIDVRLFADCSLLTRIDVSPNNPVYEDVDGALFDKQQKTLVSYPGARKGDYMIRDGVTSIGDQAFYGCMGLTSVSIPESVTSIGDWAFYGCESLTSVAIPASITFIGENAFIRCTQLTLTVTKGSYAEQYATENKIPYVLTSE